MQNQDNQSFKRISEGDRYQQARQRVQDLKGFYIHVITFLVINVGLIAANVLLSPGSWWAVWVPATWGIGLAVHAITVFGFGRWFGPEWEERETEKLMAKDGLNR